MAQPIDTTKVAPGTYKATGNDDRYIVGSDGNVLVATGGQGTFTNPEEVYAGLPDAPQELQDYVAANPDLRTPTRFRETTVLEGDLPGTAGGDVARLQETKPGVFEQQQADREALAKQLREEFPTAGGTDVGAALRSGKYEERQLRDLFGDQAVIDAKRRNSARGDDAVIREFGGEGDAVIRRFDGDGGNAIIKRLDGIVAKGDELAARESAPTPEQSASAYVSDRIDRAGGLLNALRSDDESERITRAQALAAGYTDNDIDAALSAAGDFGTELAEFETQQREAAQPEETPAQTGAIPVEVEPSIDQGAQTAFFARLESYQGESEGSYNAGLALANGTITESEARRYFGDDADEVVAEAKRLREFAAAGYYADGSLVPETLRRVLSDRAVELSQRFGRSRALDENLATDIQTINVFLTRGGLLPDYEVATISSDIAQRERFIASLRAEIAATEGPSRRLAEPRLAQAEAALEQRRGDLAEAVTRAQADPISMLRTNPPASAFIRLADRAPTEAIGITLREAALFVGTGAIATYAVRGVAAGARVGARAAGRVYTETRAGALRAVQVARANPEAGFIRLGGAISPNEEAAARAILERAEREIAEAAARSSIARPFRAADGSIDQASMDATRASLRALRARTDSGQAIALTDDQITAIINAGVAGTAASAIPALRQDSFAFVDAPEVAPAEPETEPTSPDVPSPVKPVVVPPERPPEPESPDVPSPVTPVVIPEEEPEPDPVREPFPEPGSPVVPSPLIDPIPQPGSEPEPEGSPFIEPIPQPGSEPDEAEGAPETETQPATDPETGTETDPDEQRGTGAPGGTPEATSAGSQEPGSGIQSLIDPIQQPGSTPEPSSGRGFVPTPFQRTDPQPGFDTSFSAVSEPDTDEDEGTPPPSEPSGTPSSAGRGAPRRTPPKGRPRLPRLPSGGKSGRIPGKPGVYNRLRGRKQGSVYRYYDPNTDAELVTGSPIYGKIVHSKGKGSATKSNTVISKSTKQGANRVEEFGAFDAVHQADGKVIFRQAKERWGKGKGGGKHKKRRIVRSRRR